MTVLAACRNPFPGLLLHSLVGPATLTIVLWVGAYVALDFAYPLITQRIAVDPNQQGQETPYIQNNIDMTRLDSTSTAGAACHTNPARP